MNRRRHIFRHTMGLTLVPLAVWGLVGCFPWPGSYQRSDNLARPETLFGPADSTKPLRLGTATLEDVIAALGRPPLHSADGRRATYPYWIVKSYTVWPLCFMAEPNKDQRFLHLRFDDAGRLAGYR